jgi:drug/metabolite transporter (DMT)-like permease
VMLIFQTIIMATYMAIRNASELREVLASWRIAMWVGASGAVASIGWFTAMTIQNAALVRALGQVELVFTIIASVVVFREKIARMEMIGIVLVVGGILILLLF